MNSTPMSSLRARLDELPEQGVLLFGPGNAAVKRSWPEIGRQVDEKQAQLRSWGVAPGMRVGIIGENCPEWIVLELALLGMRCVPVAFPLEELQAMPFNELGARFGLHALFISEREAKQRGERPEWVGLLDREEGRPLRVRSPDAAGNGDVPRQLPEDVLTLVFSSGTSGRPKCLMISRKGTEDQIRCFGRDYRFQPDDRILLALPLSIYQQRLMLYTAVIHGFNVILVDAPRIFHALQSMRPTIIAGPPMLYEPLENRFHSLPGWQRLGLTLTGHALRNLAPGALRQRLQRRLFAPFHEAFGGAARFMLTGAAPARRSTLELYELLGLPLFQAYGLTETGFVSWSLPDRNRIGATGRLVHEGSVEIAEDGEILVQFANPQCLGYFDCPEEDTLKVFQPDGRIATGDIGRMDAEGYLYILGRKKQIIVTQGGYKIQPEIIEREFESLRDIKRAVLFGGGELPNLVALISLSTDTPEARERVERHIANINTQLPSTSRVGRVVFTSVQLNRENGLLNRNLKVDRDAVYRHFRAELAGAN